MKGDPGTKALKAIVITAIVGLRTISYLSAVRNKAPNTKVYNTWDCIQSEVTSLSSSSSFYLFIKQFHKHITADNTRTGPTRLANSGPSKEKNNGKEKKQRLGTSNPHPLWMCSDTIY